MINYWKKIEDWIKSNNPVMLETLREGATEENLYELENILGVTLPKDFREFLSIHNGQTWTNLKLFDGDRLLGSDEIIITSLQWKDVLPTIDADSVSMFGLPARSDPDQGVKDDWWNNLWVPITSDGCGDSYCIDLDPTPEGKPGQIIRMCHDGPRRELLAASFHEWINQYVNDLENGVYISSNDIGWGGIIRPFSS